MKDKRRDDDVPRRDRRRFLGQASCAAVGTTALFNTVLNLRMFNALASPGEDYRALVCLFMFGGNDGNNTVIPTTAAEYQQYATGRTGALALAQGTLLPLTPRTPNSRTFSVP